MKTLTVDTAQSGARLLEFVQAAWPDVRRPFLRSLLRDGLVTVNRMDADARTRLRPGDVVDLSLPDGVEAMPCHNPRGGEPELGLLYEDEFTLVVDKPAGVLSVPGRTGDERGVYGMLGALRPDGDLRIAHRLDRETSGCLALGKGLDGARWLDAAFREGEIEKRYLALVLGEVRDDSFSVRKALGPDPRRPGRVRVVREGSKRSRSARTDVEVVERFRGFTLVAVRPLTGRGHQIRVHLKSAGHGIVGDRDYGGARPLLLSRIKHDYKLGVVGKEVPLLERTFLHAHQLTLPRPDSEPVTVTAPMPEELEVVLRKMRRFAVNRGRSSTCD